MDQRRLIEFLKQSPQIWDRSCPEFRDKDAKERAWEQLANKMNVAVPTCKDAFKSLREKYIREREKAHHQGDPFSNWDLLNHLKFLDPHILPRISPWNGNHCVSEDDVSIHSDSDPTDFDKQLIHMVKKASPIWDRNSNNYPNRASKNQLWEQISFSLHRDVNTCMLRWKALREKYIRQKVKFQEGDVKWELLDDLTFLDKVIQYRRKQSDVSLGHYNSTPNSNIHSHTYLEHSPHPSSHTEGNINRYISCNIDDDDYACTDSSNEFLNIVKEENAIQQVADSSLNICSKRFRDNSTCSYGDTSIEKRLKPEENSSSNNVVESERARPHTEKSTEQLFGDLVASLLSKKPGHRRNMYMIEIMTILSK